MPTNKPQVQYKDGDVVEVPYYGGRGILFLPPDLHTYSLRPDKDERDLDRWVKQINKVLSGKSYMVRFFGQNGDDTPTIITRGQIRHCRGITKPDLCDKCRYKFECFTIRRNDCQSLLETCQNKNLSGGGLCEWDLLSYSLFPCY